MPDTMPNVRITARITVDGVPYLGGEVVPRGEVPAGCLASMLRLGQAVETDDPAPLPPDAPPPADPPKPTKKK